MQEYISLSYIGLPEAALRLLLAAAFTFIIGLERGEKNKPIDFRAYMIVAVTTCTLTLISQELAHRREYEIDLGKVISGILAGIGFLGAGAILKVDDEKIIGTATGASVWSAGGMGLALGFGFYGLAILLFVSVLVTLVLGGMLARKLKFRED